MAQTLTTSIPKTEVTFSSWNYELKTKYGIKLDLDDARMYYFGAYSPKKVYQIINNIPLSETRDEHHFDVNDLIGWDYL